MGLIFYDCPPAPSPRRARIILAEKNVPYEVVHVDISAGEQFSEAYRAINPNCTVPALKLEDGTVLTENAGIAAYLEARFPGPALLGETDVEKGQVASWVAKVEMEGLLAAAEALRNSSPMMKDRALTGPVGRAQIPELAERGMARLKQFFDMLDARLEGRDYLATDSFTNADIVAAVTVDFARVVKLKAGPEHKNLLRWRENLSKRPSMSV